MKIDLIDAPVTGKEPRYYALMVRSASNKVAKQHFVLVSVRTAQEETSIADVYLGFTKHKDKPVGYTPDCTKFGQATLHPDAHNNCITVRIGVTDIARIYDRPVLGSTAVSIPLGTFYLAPIPDLSLRPALLERLATLATYVAGVAVWK